MRILTPVLTLSMIASTGSPALAQARGRAVPRPPIAGAPGAPVRPAYPVAGPGYGYGYPHSRDGYGFGVGFGWGFAWYPYYHPYYSPYWYPWGWSPYFYGPHPYGFVGYPYYPYGPMDELTASLRLEVKPRETEV